MYKMGENKNYLKAEFMYWYRRKPEPEECKTFPRYDDCYAFTKEYFTKATYVKPEFDNISQKTLDEIYSVSHTVYSNFDEKFTFNEIEKEMMQVMDAQIKKADEFFEKINSDDDFAKRAELKRIAMQYYHFAFLQKENDPKAPIIMVNSNEILEPGANLLANLIDSCALSDEDDMRLYFDDEDEVIYLSWYTEDFTCENKNYWVMGIKPVVLNTNDSLIKAYKELSDISSFNLWKSKEKSNSATKGNKE